METTMHVVLERRWRCDTFTLGVLSINGTFFCHVIEDKDRNLHQFMSEEEIASKKLYGLTAIPYGQYKVVMDYSPKYKRMMPHVMDVKAWDGIRMHSGNSSKDSLGCQILGRADVKDDTPISKVKDWVSDSRVTCEEFYKRLIEAGGVCTLDVR